MRFGKSAFQFAIIPLVFFVATVSADVTGTVKLSGKIPEMPQIKAVQNNPDCAKMNKNPVFEETVVAGPNGELANVVVSISARDGKQIPAPIPAKPAVLDQKGCVYHPHVVPCMVGQAIDVKSDDHCLHNVHMLCFVNPAMNFGQPAPGHKQIDPFVAVETFKVKCDVHPWMVAWFRVLDNPFFATTDEDGKFSIDTKGLPDGDYTLTFWQERYQEKTQNITVKKGTTEKPIDFTY